MKRLWVLGFLATVAACSTKPPPPVTTQPPPPPQTAPKAVEARLYHDEAAALKAFPKYARRDGSTLTLSYDGRDGVRLTSSPKTDCEGWETCSLWTLAGIVMLDDGAVIVVRREHGEGDNYVLFDRKGDRLWLNGPPSVSPDLRYVASGQLASIISRSFTEITDWKASPRLTQQSETSCQPLAWHDATRLRLQCNRDDDGETPPFDAEATLKNGAWQLVSAQPVLPFKPRQVRTAAERAELATWEKKIGVEVLP
ncbi:hypothetical protein ABI_14540 [Asticcacaulis biprosthecium C19]|uniref:Lipoprotein n=1 Tax=Asticcacaulis biprosthecium C19 TaxID=715226 RepID=F4QIV2_9CAUL|nr:hypothetical protein [Asticcacaulis biprosthecium]EGF93015.1 hypothetical protein ABI_14540 [Asticcacaulis biprosthecium C19]